MESNIKKLQFIKKRNLSRILILLTFITSLTMSSVAAQNDSSSLAPLLRSYYDIKDALVNTNASTAAVKAGEFVSSINGIDPKTLTEAEQKVFAPLQKELASDAKLILESKDIEKQRKYFAKFSDNMYSLAKDVKLTDQPVNHAYCHMKKAYWLSAETSIKNPYYGKTMLTCGKVTETLK